MEITTSLLSIILSVVLCFFGYKLKRVAFAIAWFIIGFRLATVGLPYITPYFPPEIDPFFIEILPLLIGLLCSLIGASIERLCIFLIALGVTYVTYFNLVKTGSAELTAMGLGLCAVIGTIIGMISVSIMRPAIILLTAYVGGQQIGNILITLFNVPTNALLASIILIGVMVAGAIYQFKTTKHLA